MARKSHLTLSKNTSVPQIGVQHQSGSALLLLVTAVAILASMASYWWLDSHSAMRLQQTTEHRLYDMQEAKNRLLAFSAQIPSIYEGTTTKQSPGFFLCPDMDALTSSSAGSSNGSCSWTTNNAIGRLPTHKTTANGQYVFFSARSASGTDSFWYLIHNALRLGSAGSASFYYMDQNPVYDAMPANLTLDGEPIVAAILDAGKPLSHQIGRSRDAPAKQQWQLYLESVIPVAGGAKLTQYAHGETESNDHILAITKAEFDQQMKQAVCDFALEAAWCLNYDSLSEGHWFKTFHWSHSGQTARICQLNATGKPEGINRAECRL